MANLSPEQKERYYKNPELAKQLILMDAAKDKHTIYGAQAINAQVPGHLRKHTEDFDIKVKNPKKEARQMEKKLDKAYGGNFFRVQKARYPKTWKVKSNVTNRTVVDYTKQIKKIKSREVYGNRYEDLDSIKKQIKKTLKMEAAKFRKDKDMEALQRIRLSQRGFGW